MVGGPNVFDLFNDTRSNSNQNEPTLAGNAGLVGALIALSEASEESGCTVDTLMLPLKSDSAATILFTCADDHIFPLTESYHNNG
jgi:hypothetical protein